MNAEGWRRALGDEAWDHILRAWFMSDAKDDPDYEEFPENFEPNFDRMRNDPAARGSMVLEVAEHQVAEVLTAAFEVGFQPPPTQPRVAPTGTRVMFPGYEPALTARGLREHWAAHGHGWVIMRCEQLARAIAGPLFPQMQEIANAYEAQCDMDSIEHGDMIPGDWAGFVGGKVHDRPGVLLTKALAAGCPAPTVTRRKVKGPEK